MKELVLLGVYVADALEVARDYACRLSMRELAVHRVQTERGRSDCVVMAGSDKPPWVALFSGVGAESVASNMRSERPSGLHQLVYLTDAYAADLEWLRRRGLGFERLIPLEGTRVLRRVSATVPELGVVLELIDQPPIELGESDWLRPLIDSLIQPSRLQPPSPAARHVALSASTTSRSGTRSRPPPRATLVLPEGESLTTWMDRIAEHNWSSSRSSPSAVKADEQRTMLEEIHARGPARFKRDVESAQAAMSADGLGSQRGVSGGGRYPVASSPIFLSNADATLLQQGATQHARALRRFIEELYVGRTDPIDARVLETNPFNYVRSEWTPPSPAGLSQYLMDVALDADTGRFTVLEEGSDSGRCGLSTLTILRRGTQIAHGKTLERLKVADVEDPSTSLRQTLAEFGPRGSANPPLVVMAYRREPPPDDLVDWEDALFCKKHNVPLVAEADLFVEGEGLYFIDARNRERRRVDVLLHRRADTIYRFSDWSRLVRAGSLAIVDPVSSALVNDRALRAYGRALIVAHLDESPVLAIPETLCLFDTQQRVEALGNIDSFVFKERGGRIGRRIVRGDDLTREGRDALRAAIEDAPQAWVAQRRVRPSSTLFFEPSSDDSSNDVRVWEGSFILHAYALVGKGVISPNVFACRVFRAHEGAQGGGEAATMLACDVVVMPADSRKEEVTCSQ